MKRSLVIGFGNTLRGDDGAGVHAAHLIAQRMQDVETMSVHDLQPELAEKLAQFENVVFLDASVRTASVMLTPIEPEPADMRESSHTRSPGALLHLCDQLYGRSPARALLAEIPAVETGFSEQLSPAAVEAVHECVRRVSEWIGNTTTHGVSS